MTTGCTVLMVDSLLGHLGCDRLGGRAGSPFDQLAMQSQARQTTRWTFPILPGRENHSSPRNMVGQGQQQSESIQASKHGTPERFWLCLVSAVQAVGVHRVLGIMTVHVSGLVPYVVACCLS